MEVTVLISCKIVWITSINILYNDTYQDKLKEAKFILNHLQRSLIYKKYWAVITQDRDRGLKVNGFTSPRF